MFWRSLLLPSSDSKSELSEQKEPACSLYPSDLTVQAVLELVAVCVVVLQYSATISSRNLFQQHNFGQDHLFGVLLNESHADIMKKIGHMEVVLVLRALAVL
jgi:hypothetical protein